MRNNSLEGATVLFLIIVWSLSSFVSSKQKQRADQGTRWIRSVKLS